MALFDPALDHAEKGEIADSMLGFVNPHVFAPGKPAFPRQQFQHQEDVALPTLVGPKSWELFDLLGDDGAWLAQPPQLWDTHPGYRSMATVVHNLEVVNDAAERGVKDVQDYANTARDGVQRGRIALVSASHRIKVPEFLKNEMEENL